jgi:Cu2+-containing amine oxidase
VVSKQVVPEGQHVAMDGEEAVAAEEALLNDPQFKQVIADLQLPEHVTVVADAWIYGADSSENCPRFISFMVYMRFIDDADSCHYSAPLPIIPTVLADSLVLHEIAFTPIFGGESIKTLKDLDGPFPWEQYVQNEYAQSVREKAGEVYRRDIKPYHVTQPEGASVSKSGRVTWSLSFGLKREFAIVVLFGWSRHQVAKMVFSHWVQLSRRYSHQRCSIRWA